MANNPIPRGLRDEATVGPDPRRPRDLRRLSELRYEVADGEPDIRGWTAYASTGREVGTVADLLVDPEAGEVVMLDIDLRRGDQHTLAPIRAAWIDHATRRVVLDARALLADPANSAAPAARETAVTPGAPLAPSVAESPAALPALPRRGPLSDADIQRFDAAYQENYGERAAEREATWRVPRGSDDALEFAPRRLLDPAERSEAAGESSAGAPAVDRRVARVDDASALDDDAAIDPRELDARVRIDEGATVDADAPVAGVRYEGDEEVPHNYGRPVDAYGPGHGSGRIGFNKVVSRLPYDAASSATSDANATDAAGPDAPRSVRYRQYNDRYAGPDDAR